MGKHTVHEYCRASPAIGSAAAVAGGVGQNNAVPNGRPTESNEQARGAGVRATSVGIAPGDHKAVKHPGLVDWGGGEACGDDVVNIVRIVAEIRPIVAIQVPAQDGAVL
jgi:hypothetical protein